MPSFTEPLSRRSPRLPAYDWSQVEIYFVTVSVKGHECVLGDVVGDDVRLTDVGDAVARTWDALLSCIPGIGLDEFIVMPNHIHGIIVVPIHENNHAPTLGAVMRAFKSLSTISCNALLGRSGGRFWRSGFEEHAIRDDDELTRARQYIMGDPAHWDEDQENPIHHTAQT